MDNVSNDHEGLEVNTTQWTTTPSFTQYQEYQAAVILQKIVPPCILLLGGFGNIATIFVMRRTKDHNSSQHVIFMSLAISDLILLCSAAPDQWIWHVFSVNIKTLHISLCKIYRFTVYVTNATSAWLVTCVTVQRTMAVLWPHRMRVMCTVRRTWIVIATLILVACALYSHLLIGLEITQDDTCDILPGPYKDFFYFTFSWIDLGLASFFPTVCLIVCDIILSVTLFKAVSSSAIVARVDPDVNTEHVTDSRRKMSTRTTVRVLAISCAFLVLTLPVCVCLVWGPYYVFSDVTMNSQKWAVYYLVFTVTPQLWYTNSAINFVLYCLTGAKFRREFLSWIRCGAARVSAPSGRHTAVEAKTPGS